MTGGGRDCVEVGWWWWWWPPPTSSHRQVSRPPGAQTHGDAQSVPLGLRTGQETVDKQGNVAVFIMTLILLLLLLLLLSGKLTKLEASHSSCI